MEYKKVEIEQQKNIVLVAHDNKKHDLLEWTKFNKDLLAQHRLYATGTTGALLEKELGLEIIKLQSGPLGGDQQIGAKIYEAIRISKQIGNKYLAAKAYLNLALAEIESSTSEANMVLQDALSSANGLRM